MLCKLYVNQCNYFSQFDYNKLLEYHGESTDRNTLGYVSKRGTEE